MASSSPNDKKPSGGMFYELALRVQLVFRLMIDGRVNFFYKLIPLGSLLYLVNPFDIPTPIDDIGVITLACVTFVELCPPEIVEEHLDHLRHPLSKRVYRQPPEENVIDGEFREVSDDKEKPKE